MHEVFDFIDLKGQSVIEHWIAQERFTKRDIGQLNQKVDMLRINGFSLHPNLLAGPIQKQKHIYKLKIHAQRMLRPLLCKGPFAMDKEFTLLLGAIETNFVLMPNPGVATMNRDILIQDPNRRMASEGY